METINCKNVVARAELSLIKEALVECNGNKAHASKLLSMNRTTLICKLKRAGLLGSEEIKRLTRGYVPEVVSNE